MPKISIIVPVYNVEEYLQQCLDSIVSQSLKDIEIICVDDGSTDNSAKILDEIGAKDSRIKVVHKENAGYGAAMNVGLDMAIGEYVGIVESDDYVLPQMYETLYNAAVENDLDMVKSDAYYWIEKENFLSRIHTKLLDSYYDRVLDNLDRNYFFEFYMNIWTGIYKKSFLDKNMIRFHESPGASYQDNGYWMLTCIYANRAMWINKAFYYYRQDNPTASVRDQGKVMAMTDEYEYLENILKKRGHDIYLPYCYIWRMIRHRGNFYRISDQAKKDFCIQIKSDYDKYGPYIHRLQYLNNFMIPLIRKPDEVIDNIVKIKKKIYEKLSNTDDIVIYGAGLQGEIILRILHNEGYADKISCFAVTSDFQKEKIGNRKVIQIGKAVEDHLDALYIIAVVKTSNAYNEMTKKLQEMQVTNYISGSELVENFYIA